MFNDTDLINHLDKNQSVKVEAGCFVELNQNDLENIDTVGVYKYGDFTEAQIRQWTGDPSQYWLHKNIITSLQNNELDVSDYVYFGERRKSDYFSLVDCFTEFRPRSGINKLVQPLAEDRTYIDDFRSVRRPRYYPAAVNDRFKYWTSWNTDIGPTVGVSNSSGAIKYAAPFIVYKEPVAANRITVKIQTGIGEVVKTAKDLFGTTDPLGRAALSTIPKNWKIQYLDVFNTWRDAMVFVDWNPEVLRPEFGHLDIVYMVKNPSPSLYPNFVLKGYIPTTLHLPIYAYVGEAFCVGRDTKNLGRLYVWNGTSWVDTGDIDFEWRIADPKMNPEEYAVKDFVNPIVYNPTITGDRTGGDTYDEYAGFVFLRGLRILVNTMVARDKPFELIELSPRLFANVSDMVQSYSIDKAISDSDSVLPVGGMSVSSGSVVLSNSDLALSREMEYKISADSRSGSILAGRVRTNTKFIFYEIVKEVLMNGNFYDKFIPVKNLYVVGRPVPLDGMDDVSLTLRDLNFRFEEELCPNLMMKDCTLTKAVATLLDSIGFTNYIFYFGDRPPLTKSYKSTFETVFPYFMCNEKQSIAEVLDQLSIASQCAIFFDEYNNLVVMPREHFGVKEAQYVLRGNNVNGKYTNVESINISTNAIADAEITFTHRDLARGNLPMLSLTESGTREAGEAGNVTAYKPTDVWNIDKADSTTLSAAPLNATLTSTIPAYSASAPGGITNNTFDIGIYAQYFPFSGLVTMEGEIIEFDAKEYTIGGRLVWVNSSSHLSELIGRSNFATNNVAPMIFPTGKMRIKTELTADQSGTIRLLNHGRGKFGTTPATHPVEPTYWMNATTYKFSDTALSTVHGVASVLPNYSLGKHTSGTADNATAAKHHSTSNYIYNSLHSRNSVMVGSPMTINPASLTQLNKERRIMRSSALTFRGDPAAKAGDVYMKLLSVPGTHYNLFGTRIGIIGESFSKVEGDISQRANGTRTLGSYKGSDGQTHNVEGAGGGLVLYSNRVIGGSSPRSHDGYYFEIVALNTSYNSDTEDEGQTDFANINFYKINRGIYNGDGQVYNVAVPLYSAYTEVIVTSGSQTVRDRTIPSAQTSVYDLAVGVSSVGSGSGYQRVFYLYVNDLLIGIARDPASGNGYFPELHSTHTSIGIFARGSSEVQFEHLYAVGTAADTPQQIFAGQNIMSRPRAFKAFSPSAIYTAAALDGGPSKGSIYFEEFGTMAREAKHIRAQFDLFPVAISQVAKRPVFDRTYTVSGYYANPFFADFMLWSQADRLMDLASSGGESNLSLLGLPFQDNEPTSITIDDYLTGNYEGAATNVAYDINTDFRKNLLAIRASGATDRIAFDSQYIQNRDYALKMLKWLKGFMGVERTELEVKAFGIPHIQLGDIVRVEYDIPLYDEKKVPANPKGSNITPLEPSFIQKTVPFIDQNKLFMVQSISIDRNEDGPDYTLRLIEIPSATTWNAGDF